MIQAILVGKAQQQRLDAGLAVRTHSDHILSAGSREGKQEVDQTMKP